MYEQEIEQLKKIVSENQRFMVCCHVSPDGDAIGSLLAVGAVLKKLDKQVEMVCTDGVPSVYEFFADQGLIRREIDWSFRPEVLICVDCAERSRVAVQAEIWDRDDCYVVNIDHHVTNTNFGNLNMISPDAAATGEFVYSILKSVSLDIDETIAIYLYTAMATDTGFFRYESTSAYTLATVSELVEKYGVRPNVLSELINERRTYASLKMLGEVLNTLKLTMDGRVAHMLLLQKMVDEYQVENEETEGYVNYAKSIKGVEVGILFKENTTDGVVKVSWRSKSSVDVSRLAKHFGGGGHARAAGCTIAGTLSEVETKVLEYLKQYYEADKCYMD